MGQTHRREGTEVLVGDVTLETGAEARLDAVNGRSSFINGGCA